MCSSKTVSLRLPDFEFLLQRFREETRGFTLLQNVVADVDVHDQERTCVQRHPDAFVIDKTGMLNRVDAGLDRRLDPLCTMCVRSNLAVSLM